MKSHVTALKDAREQQRIAPEPRPLEELQDEIARDARREPERYLKESVVPEGGE